MKTNTAELKSTTILSLAFFYGNSATHSHKRSIASAWLNHAHSFDRCGIGSLLSRTLVKGTNTLRMRLEI